VSAPPRIGAVHERLGTRPAGREAFEALLDHTAAPEARAEWLAVPRRAVLPRASAIRSSARRIRGFSGSLQIATSGRAKAQQHGVKPSDLLPCDALGPDRTELAGCTKRYLPANGSRIRASVRRCHAARSRHGRTGLAVRRFRAPPPGSRRTQRLRADPRGARPIGRLEGGWCRQRSPRSGRERLGQLDPQ
jgi:hypothetical protein